MSWGVVATAKAACDEILDFAAHHIEIGAHQVHIYLDDENPEAEARLSRHPLVAVIRCDDAYWTHHHKQRPEKHQSRQARNMHHALLNAEGVDWLAHIDVDELLWPRSPLAGQLASLPADCLVARVYPVESLAPSDPDDPMTYFKVAVQDAAERHRITRALFPPQALDTRGGFLSHTSGKIFLRTGQPDLRPRIHHAYLNGTPDPGIHVLQDTELCHLHSKDWPAFLAAYRYRLRAGSYRAELRPTRPEKHGGINLHEMMNRIETEGGIDGLRRFYDSVCKATPELRAQLEGAGLLRAYRLDLDAKRSRHFPGIPWVL